MVGLNAFGEGAWACEQLYNARLGDEKPADRQLLAFSTERWTNSRCGATTLPPATPRCAARKACATAPMRCAWVSRCRRPHRLPSSPCPSLWSRRSLKRLPKSPPSCRPKPDLVLDLEMPSAPAISEAPESELTLDLDALAPAEATELEFELPVENLAETHSDFEATQPLDAEPDTVLPEPVEPEVALVHLDFEAEAAAPPPPPAEDEGFDIDLSLPEPALPVPAEELPALDLQLDLGEEEPVLELAEAGEPEPAAPALAVGLPEAMAEPQPEPEPEAVEATEPAEAAMVQIGDLRISEALHRIFSAEAEELAQRLLAALRDWAPLHDEPPPANTEGLCACAGRQCGDGRFCRPVGAGPCSRARARARPAGRPHRFQRRRLLPASGAGHPAIARPLRRRRVAGRRSDLDRAAAALRARAPRRRRGQPGGRAGPRGGAGGGLEAEIEDDFVPGEPDNIDAELWEIFEEEAGELLHQLHARLRDWTSHPQDAARGDACMRTLHTSRAAPAWPAPCTWASWRTGWSPMC